MNNKSKSWFFEKKRLAAPWHNEPKQKREDSKEQNQK